MEHGITRKLNRRVTLRRETRQPDGAGGYEVPWSDVATVWAGIEPKRASELVRAEGLSNEVTHVVTLRYRPDVQADMEVRYGGRQFAVLSVVNPLEANRYLELVCKELT